ncbi:hypothetical protein BPLS_P0406 [Bathymodiolus platifrons methanotrophic gill symbiont]|nr:hypothetical protein BPLS_P0406 [Bathymodiolus platifrons methanotrophic gill symbiont]
MSQSNNKSFIARLNQHPKLRERVESLLNVVENTTGDCIKADDAEQHVIEEIRQMGNDALHCWGSIAADREAKQLREQRPGLHGNGKKKALCEIQWVVEF